MTKLAVGTATLFILGCIGIAVGKYLESLSVIFASGLLLIISLIVLITLDAIDSRK